MIFPTVSGRRLGRLTPPNERWKCGSVEAAAESLPFSSKSMGAISKNNRRIFGLTLMRRKLAFVTRLF